MKMKLLNVATMVVLMLSAVACNEKDEPAVDNGDNETPTIPVDFDIFSSLTHDEMVYVEGGTFLMGAQSSSSSQPNYDSDAYKRESPVHTVTLSSYYISKYEVTQALWEYVMTYSGKVANGSTMPSMGIDPWLDANPSTSYGLGTNYPAYYVSYDDIVSYFLPRLNQITGKKYRLPTEAEWEYAARGGQKDEYTRTQGVSGTYYQYAGSNTPDDVAWYKDNSSIANPVGTKSPNALGLHDMGGNVWEWCSDWYKIGYDSASVIDPVGPDSGDGRVMRGGTWSSKDIHCRVSGRSGTVSERRYYYVGFRLALSL